MKKLDTLHNVPNDLKNDFTSGGHSFILEQIIERPVFHELHDLHNERKGMA